MKTSIFKKSTVLVLILLMTLSLLICMLNNKSVLEPLHINAICTNEFFIESPLEIEPWMFDIKRWNKK